METKLKEILYWLEQYKETTRCRGVVIGISGGKDSTVVAMLAKKVWGDNVLGILMPNHKQIDISDALEIAKTIGVKFKFVNIGKVYDSLLEVLEDEGSGSDYCNGKAFNISQKAHTNIPPRIRMTVLYAIAQTLGYRVIGTGNASESYIGWTTKWGDSAYDFNPIAHLTCTEVMALGELLADEFGLDKKYVNKTPSDGLCGKSDEDSFGFTYATLDGYISGGMTNTDYETALKIEQMHQASEHKRNMPATLE